jgi:hypothetical protein
MTTSEDDSDDYSRAANLTDLLAKCCANGADADLTPELVEVALEILFATPASAYYQIEKVAGDGTVTSVAVVCPLLLRETLEAASEAHPGHKVRINVGSDYLCRLWLGGSQRR